MADGAQETTTITATGGSGGADTGPGAGQAGREANVKRDDKGFAVPGAPQGEGDMSRRTVGAGTEGRFRAGLEEKAGSATPDAASTPTNSGVPSKNQVYAEPDWSRPPKAQFKLEVLKGGRIIDTIDISNKPFYIVGRTDACDIQAEHPSISRNHAVLQHGDDGFWYAYDLNSTHGTKLNKASMPPRRYFRLRIGQMLRFGASTRLYILQGPEDLTAEEDARLETQEDAIRQHREQKLQEALKQKEAGISWGVQEDAKTGDDDSGDDADVMAEIAARIQSDGPDFDASQFYRKDPQRALRHLFSQMGEEMEFTFEQVQIGRAREFVASLEMPVTDAAGRPMVVSGQGERKKDAVEKCSLNACRALDARNMLRDAPSSKRPGVFREEDDDVYGGDDDNDEFYDRTGDVQRKRAKRKHRAAATGQKKAETAETLEAKKTSLSEQKAELEKEIAALEKTLEEASSQDLDEVDRYVKDLEAKTTRTKTKKLRKEADQLAMDLKQTEQMLKFLKPALA